MGTFSLAKARAARLCKRSLLTARGSRWFGKVGDRSCIEAICEIVVSRKVADPRIEHVSDSCQGRTVVVVPSDDAVR